jgi:antitoxin component YwqK of YwqJK toxin-antitoxin module
MDNKMKAVLVLVVILFVGLVNAQNLTDAKGKKQGPWSKIYPGTKVYQYKGQFKDDKPVGTFTYYYITSKVKAVVKHEPNSNRSVAYFYHENGVVMSYGIYRDMKKDSVWMNYGPSGKLSNAETYKNDLLNGKRTVYYVTDDPSDKILKIMEVSNYQDGKLNGELIQFFENGTLREKGSYVLGKKNGVWEKYHSNGAKMIQERFKNGLKHGWCYAYSESGKEAGKVFYYNGEMLQGKALDKKLAELKQQGIDPNH